MRLRKKTQQKRQRMLLPQKKTTQTEKRKSQKETVPAVPTKKTQMRSKRKQKLRLTKSLPQMNRKPMPPLRKRQTLKNLRPVKLLTKNPSLTHL